MSALCGGVEGGAAEPIGPVFVRPVCEVVLDEGEVPAGGGDVEAGLGGVGWVGLGYEGRGWVEGDE